MLSDLPGISTRWGARITATEHMPSEANVDPRRLPVSCEAQSISTAGQPLQASTPSKQHCQIPCIYSRAICFVSSIIKSSLLHCSYSIDWCQAPDTRAIHVCYGFWVAKLYLLIRFRQWLLPREWSLLHCRQTCVGRLEWLASSCWQIYLLHLLSCVAFLLPCQSSDVAVMVLQAMPLFCLHCRADYPKQASFTSLAIDSLTQMSGSCFWWSATRIRQLWQCITLTFELRQLLIKSATAVLAGLHRLRRCTCHFERRRQPAQRLHALDM